MPGRTFFLSLQKKVLMDLKQRFYDAISALTPGNRDANLVRVATYGVGAGLSQGEVVDAIMSNAPGDTRPDPAAVRHAVANCYGVTRPRQPSRLSAPSEISAWPRKTEAQKLEDFRRTLPLEVRESVRRLVGASRGATPDDLILHSPTPIPLAPREQAAAHIRALSSDWRWRSWFGTMSPRGGKRGLVADPAAVAYAIETRLCPRIPTHISLNPLTGEEGLTKEGRPSYDCLATVAALHFCLVEFDSMPLADQLALWTSVTRTLREEVPVVSIVYSGGKSIHAVILCPPRSHADLAHEGVIEADRIRYLSAWDALIRRFASSTVPSERMDITPSKNAAVHTRVAGAVRQESGKHQTLLYLDAQLAKDRLELF